MPTDADTVPVLGPRVYSHTRLSTFEQCPLKYKIKYLDCVPAQVETIEAFVGKRVHEILRELHSDPQSQHRIPLPHLIARYRSAWEQSWSRNLRIVRSNETEEAYKAYGARCIQNYYRRDYQLDRSQTLYVEHPVDFQLLPRTADRMTGFIDRVAIRRGTFEIHDYKTSRRYPNKRQLEFDRQLSLYELGLRAQIPDAKHVDLIWHFVARSVNLRLRRTTAQLQQIREETHQLILRVEAAYTFPAKVTPLCNWCEYQSSCPAFSNKSVMVAAVYRSHKRRNPRSGRPKRQSRGLWRALRWLMHFLFDHR